MTAEEFTRKIIDEQLCPENPYTLETNLETGLGANSLDKVQLIIAFEDALDIEVPDSEIDSIRTVSQLVELVRLYVKEISDKEERGAGTTQSSDGKEVKGPVV